MNINVILPKDIEERFQYLVKKSGDSPENDLASLIAENVAEMEAYDRAAAVLGRVKSGEERVYSLDQVEQELGLAD
jgi:RHH-type transcriptional regulator, rel operon repressor / antitoxin RelB